MELRRKMILYIIVAFLLGGVGGGFVGSRLSSPPERVHRRDGGSLMKEFATRLKLDERQTQMVDSILESQRSTVDTIRKAYWRAYRDRRDTIRSEIQKILDDEQQKLYDEYVKEMQHRESRRRSGGNSSEKRSR
jgi:aminopeptidase N